MYAIESNF